MQACERCLNGVPAGAAFCPGCGRAAQPPAQVVDYRRLTPTEQRDMGGPSARIRIWVVGTVVLFVMTVAAAALGFVVTRSLANGCGDELCSPGRLAPPVPPADPYVSATYGYRLDAASPRCPEDMRVRERGDRWIEWTVTGDQVAGEWPVRVEAEPAEGRTPEAMVAAYQARLHPDAVVAYVIPRAHLGFHPGHGVVYDLTLLGESGAPVQARLILMAAVSDGLAITLSGVGPLDTRQYAHPNPARTSTVICFSDLANTITWPGDDPF